MSSTISSTGFVSLLEGNAGSTGFAFTVTRTGDTTSLATVNYAVQPYFSGNTVNAADFVGGALPSGMLSFAPGETSKTIMIDVAGDTDVESDEGFSLLLTSSTGGAVIGNNFASGTIRADDGAGISLSSGPGSISEGNAGSTAYVFTATRSGDLTSAVSATWTVTGSSGPFFGAAATGADFVGGVLPSGIVSFAANETSKSFTVEVQGDTIVEPNEGFQVNLSNPSAGAYASAGGFGTTIINDDGAVIAFASGPAPSVNEGNAGSTPMVFNLVRSGDTSQAVSATWSINPFFVPDSNAVAGSDFVGGVLPSGVVNFAAGQTAATITLDIAGDTVTETNEVVRLALTSGTGASIGAFNQSLGTVVNDDGNLAIISMQSANPLSASVTEGNSGSTLIIINVLRSGDTTSAVTANWAVNSGTANAADFLGGVLPSGTVSFAPGQTISSFVINVAGDTLIEPNEGFGVSLTSAGPGAQLGLTTQSFGNINNDDGAILNTTTTSGFNANEGNAGSTPFNITITRTGDTSSAVTADWAVAAPLFGGVSPVSASDFVGGVFPTGTVSFNAGQTSQIITVNFAGDTVFEPNETFVVNLTNPSSGAAIGSSVSYNITNDDGVVIVFAGQANPSVLEGNAGASTPMNFIVQRNGDTTVQASVKWAVSSFSGATASDFVGGVLPSGTLTFAAGETQKTVTLNIAGDATLESNESVSLQLISSSANATLGSFTSINGTITNDDGAILAVTAGPLSTSEGNAGSTPFNLTVTRSGDLSIAASANWVVAPGFVGNGLAAANASDFVGAAFPSGTVSFAIGETTQTITVNVAGDTLVEPNETFFIQLSNPSAGASIGSTFSYIIYNDDGVPSVTTGTAGNDTITPSSISAGVTGSVPSNLNDTILAGGGNDSVNGGGGDDSINAGTGNDSIFGGAGNDTINSNDVGPGDSADNVSGGEGDDLLLGLTATTGSETSLNGGLGNDTIYGYGRFENLADYATYDRVSFVPRTEALVAVLGANGTATLGSEVDTLINVVNIRGTAQSDLFTGSNSNEYFQPGLGNDTVNGGGGTDRVVYGQLSLGVNVNLTTNLTNKGAQTDTLSSIEDIVGSNYDDTLTGNGESNVFRPIAGNDAIDGGGGYDVVRYTTTYSTGGFGTYTSGVTVNLTTGIATDNWGFTDTLVSIERAEGSNLHDDLTGKVVTDTTTSGGSSDIQLRGLSGNDTLRAPQNDTRVYADYREDPGAIRVNLSGTDTVLGGVNVAARTGRDGYGGTDSFDKIQGVLGSNFNDIILGTDRADRLYGLAGNDMLTGGAGDDTLGGGAGVDSYTGGAGFDVVTFQPYSTTSGDQPTQGVIANLVTLTIANDGYGNAEFFAGGANDIEFLIGTNFADDLTGARVNWTGEFGESQQTYLRGGNGADILRGVLADARFITAEYLTDLDVNGDGFGVTVDLANQTATDGWGNTDTLENIGAARGSAFDDSLIGNGADNWFRGEGGDDTIEGGLGRDLVSYRSSTGSVILDLESGVAQDGLGGTDSLSGIEDAVGSPTASDTLRGDAEANSLNGYGGDDVLEGRGGDDTLIGDTGNDTAVFSGARARYTVTRDTATGDVTVVDSLVGGDGTDLMRASVETLRFTDGDVLTSGLTGGTLSIAALSADLAEGQSGTTAFTFTVTRTGDLSGSATAAWAVTGSGANPAAAADFAGVVLPTGAVSFATGEASKVVTVNVLADSSVELDEGFTVTLSAPTGATLGTASAAGTIRNDDALLSLAGGAPVAEGQSGNTAITFTVTRSGSTAGASSAAWAVTGTSGQPANAADFAGGVLPSGTVSFAAGETSKIITVNVAGDTAVELNEEFTLTLSAPSPGTSLGAAIASRVIINDDAILNIAPLGALNEGNSSFSSFIFSVTRLGDTSGTAQANFTVSGAVSGDDFAGGVLPSGTVFFSAGQSTSVIFLSVVGDTVAEPDELFTVTLSAPSGATLGTASASATILNDDVASSLSIAALAADRAEGNAGSTAFTFTVTRIGGAGGAASANWAVTGNGAVASDFAGGVLPSGTVSFAAGETSQVITVNVVGDATIEADEGFTVTLSAPIGATLGTASAAGIIRNDDTLLVTGTSGPDTITGTSGNDTQLGLAGNDQLDGRAGNDSLDGGADNDTLLASAGNDVMNGGAGIDTLVFGSGFAAINVIASLAVGIAHKGALGDDTLIDIENITGNAGNDTLTGNDLANLLTGGAGDDRLVGGLGNDSLVGGLGLDSFVVNAGTDTVVDLGLDGADVLIVSAGATANATLAAAWTATAESLNNGAANLTAAGFNVNLALAGGANAWFVTNVASTRGVTITGSDGNDSLTGGSGADILTGGLGDDRLIGGLGLDRFIVDAGTDRVTDLGLGAVDRLNVSAGATANVTMGAAWAGNGSSSNNGTARLAAANFDVDLTGVVGASGWSVTNAGNAVGVRLTGSVRADTLTGGDGNDSLTGGIGNDSLVGGAGDDELTGGTGNDTQTGGLGLDRFLVDVGTDTVTDLGLGGADVLVVSAGASAFATLGAAWVATAESVNDGTANLTTAGFGANLALAGGASAWFVTNAASTRGVTLVGSNGNDSLAGGSGSDILTGGLGDDRMTGGLGLDRFIVDAGTDRVLDLGLGAVDRLNVSAGATANATLAAAWVATSSSANNGTARLAASGFDVDLTSVSGASGWSVSNSGEAVGVRLTGSVRSDVLTGGDGNDSLFGGLDHDTLSGGAGDDEFTGGQGYDRLIGGLGADRFVVDVGRDSIGDLGVGGADVVVVLAGAQVVAELGAGWVATAASVNDGLATLTAAGFSVDLGLAGGANGWTVTNAGYAAGVSLVGSAGADSLTGGNGDDTLTGGLGADVLRGRNGADSFVFASAAAADGDVITDFIASRGDMLDLRLMDAGAGAGDQAFSYIGAAAFALGVEGQLRFAAGVLEGDLDGNGVADFQVQMTGVTSLSAASIWL